MSRILWNEGRVVGYSAYELYVKQLLNKDPNAVPATEMEWLNSMMGSGASMLLRIGTDNVIGTHSIEISLPTNSRLCGASTLIASFFIGAGDASDKPDNMTFWSSIITDYGPLISNTDSMSPSTSIPPTMSEGLGELTANQQLQLKEYMKIVDGIACIKGTWSTNSNKPPAKDLSPNLSNTASIRIAFKDKIEHPFYLLITGFQNKLVINGLSDTSGSCNTTEPQNGDFLGPANYPWASKIVFTIPSAYMAYYGTGGAFERKLPASESIISVNSQPIIDMKQSSPNDYYATTDIEAAIDMNVTTFSTTKSDSACLFTYSANTLLPPTLYGSIVLNIGESKIYPIDVGAPNTVKFTHGLNFEYALAVEERFKNYSLLRDTDNYCVYEFDKDKVDIGTSPASAIVPIAEVNTEPIGNYIVVGEALPPFLARNYLPEGENEQINGVLHHIRYAGYLPGKAKQHCMFEITDDVFKAGGIYSEVTKTGVIQLCKMEFSTSETPISSWDDVLTTPQFISKYYVILLYESSHYANINSVLMYPVRRSDNYFNFITKQMINIISSGSNINHLFKFSNKSAFPSSSGNDSGFLGGWWSVTNSQYVDGKAHKSIDSFFSPNELIYQNKSPSPATIQQAGRTVQFTEYFKTLKLSSIIKELKDPSAELYKKLNSKYVNGTISEFCNAVAYKDVYTDKDLSPSHRNRKQPNFILSNDRDTSVVYGVIDLGIDRNASTVGKLSYIQIPDELKDEVKADDPCIVHVTTGRKNSRALSMTDMSGNPYFLTGDIGSIESDNLTWEILLKSLTQNKRVDILGETLSTVRNSIIDYHIEASAPTPEGLTAYYEKIELDIVIFKLYKYSAELQYAYANVHLFDAGLKDTPNNIGQHFSDVIIKRNGVSSTLSHLFSELAPIINAEETALGIELHTLGSHHPKGAVYPNVTNNAYIYISKNASNGIVLLSAVSGEGTAEIENAHPSKFSFNNSIFGAKQYTKWATNKSKFTWSNSSDGSITIGD